MTNCKQHQIETPNSKIKPIAGEKFTHNKINKGSFAKSIKKFSMLINSKDKQELYNFNNLIDDFLLSEKVFVKETTFSHYTNIINTHIRPYFNRFSFDEIDLNLINLYINEKLSCGRIDGKGGLSNKSVKDICSILKMILKYGSARGLLPSSLVEFSIPKERKKDIKILTLQETSVLEKYVCNSNDSYKLGVYICLYTGLRIGEICALKWTDIDFDNKTLNVSKTISRITDIDNLSLNKTKIIIDAPKTDSSIRKIPLPDGLITILFCHKSKTESIDSYVLTGTEKYIEPRNYYKKYKQYLTECNMPSYNFHTLRHTFATRCVELGFDPKTLSEILGHSDVKITLSRYVHPSMDMKRTCMEKLFEISV